MSAPSKTGVSKLDSPAWLKVSRQTSRKKFRQKCTEMNDWLRKIRNHKKDKEWWPTLAAKLRGHYQY
ncbi:MAG: hypothetical protein V3W44_05405 [Dehalococcoidales bacterium]